MTYCTAAPCAAMNLSRPLCRHPVALAVLLLLAGASVQAQQRPAPAAAEVLQVAQASAALPAVTVTATLTEQDARTAPASVTVIGRDELAARNATDLLDAVRGAPGLGASSSPSRRCATKRPRHFDTVCGVIRRCCATALLSSPLAHASTMRERKAKA